jgi:hypothetical protein
VSEFLEGYGEVDARRSRRFWRVVIGAVLLLALAGGLYFGLRSYPAKRKVSQFVEDLRRRDYRAAYQLWGCTPTSACRDYTIEKFMEDWGPASPRAEAASMAIQRTRYCGPGVIVTLRYGRDSEASLWYERKDSTLGFAPWPTCAPQPKPYQ